MNGPRGVAFCILPAAADRWRTRPPISPQPQRDLPQKKSHRPLVPVTRVFMVEMKGFEPSASALRRQRSPN